MNSKHSALLIPFLLALFFAAPVLAFDTVTPSQAYELVTENPNAYIIDVRTAAEWQYVGHPGQNRVGDGAALEGKIVHLPWLIELKGTMLVNPSFLSDIDELFQRQPQVLLIVMCRSGNRSVPAAALLEQVGYQVVEMPAGFEGRTDKYGYRTVNGWKLEGWPYNFSPLGAYRD